MDPTRRWPAGLARLARRMGPLPYSAAGPGPPIARPPAEVLAPLLLDLLDGIWDELGEPDPLTLVEVGAGEAELARELLRLGPRSLTALRYVLVEADPVRRDRQSGAVAIESPALVLGPVGREEDVDVDEGNPAVAGLGPLLTSLGELPHVAGPTVVLAVGFVSTLPADRLEWRGGAWYEVRLAVSDPARETAGPAGSAPADELAEVTVPLDAPRSRAAEDLVTGSLWPQPSGPRPDPARFAVHTGATAWLSQAVRSAESGRLVVVDHWTGPTLPLPPDGEVPVALAQLAAVRAPLAPEPTPLADRVGAAGPASPLSMVSWRLG